MFLKCVSHACCICLVTACGNYDFRYDMQKGLRPRRSVRTAMAHEIMMYGIVQKDGLGFDRAVEECKARMNRYSVSPNMLIIPPQLALYMTLAPEEKITCALTLIRTATRTHTNTTAVYTCLTKTETGKTNTNALVARSIVKLLRCSNVQRRVKVPARKLWQL